MTFVQLLPAILSALLLGAHFLRAGQTALAVVLALSPLLLLVKREWVARATQLVLVLGAVEWLRTLAVFVGIRRELGEPWTRLAIILGGVALFTFGAAVLFSLSGRLRRRYGIAPGEPAAS